MALLLYGVVLLVIGVRSDDSDKQDSCSADGYGAWSRALEEWTTSANSGRHGRIMALPQSKGYYVTDRVGTPYLSPPPPSYSPGHVSQAPAGPGYKPPAQMMHVPQGYKEWEGKPSHPGSGKIVNRPPGKDKYVQNYPAPGQRPGVDRVDEPPRRQVSETDLYLLSALEKLAHRADFMEKRLRRLEESLYYALQSKEPELAPCPTNFTRVGSSCYSMSSSARDWKDASLACRALGAALIELHDDRQKKVAFAWLAADRQHGGEDLWTGGLNPGLLWIWAHSARPVNGTVAGDGRCLAAVHDAALNSHAYRGRDCSSQLRYVCVKDDLERLGNEVQRVARARGGEARRPGGEGQGDDNVS